MSNNANVLYPSNMTNVDSYYGNTNRDLVPGFIPEFCFHGPLVPGTAWSKRSKCLTSTGLKLINNLLSN